MSERASIETRRLDPGYVIADRYEVQSLIGTGGMATVYRVLDHKHADTPLAIKVLHKQFAEDKIYVERFLREVQFTSHVRHPNIVRTYDIGTDDNLIYFTMEYVPADSLEQVMAKGSFTAEEIAHLIVEICEGLRMIHSLGLIHRDLKPGNVLLGSDGEVKITDFGVVRQEGSTLTQENQKLGSVCYMAPEVWLGKELTPSVDLYSLGILLYELVTGNVPFEHEWPGEIMHMHLEDKVIPPKERNPHVPDWFDELIMRLLEKSPEKRFESASAVIKYLRMHALYEDENTEALCIAARRYYALGEEPLPEDDPKRAVSRRSRRITSKYNKSYVFRLTSTQLIEEASREPKRPRRERKATVTIPMPRRAALIFEIEPPSRDFIFFGIFFISLQLFDWFFTSVGTSRMGVGMEGNPLLKGLMVQFGADEALAAVKVFAMIGVVFMTILAKRMRWVKDLISVLSCIYLFAAIIPWLYILLLG